ncbi:protein furry-like, partial [Trifolium medium]|nr:protein furry-like [Trifolium medium]
MDAAQSPHIYAIVSQLVESTLCWEALSVLEALLQSCSSLTGSHPHDLGSFENGISGIEEKLLAPQTSFKARSGPLQYGMGSGHVSVSSQRQGEYGMGSGHVSVSSQRQSEYGMGSGHVSVSSQRQGGLNESQREVTLQNTRLFLGRVLDRSAL